MKYLLVLILLILLNSAMWVFGSREFIENKLFTDQSQSVVNIDDLEIENEISSLPFEVINPERVRLQSEKVYSSQPCLLAGPIESEIITNEIRQEILIKENIQMVLHHEKAQKVIAYRVYMGPDKIKNIEKIRSKLEDIGISEVYIYDNPDNNDEEIISLGVYAYKKSALKYYAQLRKNGFDAKVKQDKVSTGARFWLLVNKANNTSNNINLNVVKNLLLDSAKKYQESSTLKVEIESKCPV